MWCQRCWRSPAMYTDALPFGWQEVRQIDQEAGWVPTSSGLRRSKMIRGPRRLEASDIDGLPRSRIIRRYCRQGVQSVATDPLANQQQGLKSQIQSRFASIDWC